MIGRQIAAQALAKLKAARAAKPDHKLPLDEWLAILGKAIDDGIEEHMAQITGEPVLSKLSAPQRKGLFDAMVSSCGYNPDEITRAKAAEITTAIRDIRLVMPNLSPNDLTGRASSFKRKHPDWILTPTALAKWWGDLSPPKKERSIYDAPPEGWREVLRRQNPGLIPEFYDRSWEEVRVSFGAKVLAECASK